MSKEQPVEAPERIRVCVRAGRADWIGVAYADETADPSAIHEYVRADSSPVAQPLNDVQAKAIPRKLTLPELNHLSGLLEAEREAGSYAGPREQYYARTERLIEWCNEQTGRSR